MKFAWARWAVEGISPGALFVVHLAPPEGILGAWLMRLTAVERICLGVLVGELVACVRNGVLLAAGLAGGRRQEAVVEVDEERGGRRKQDVAVIRLLAVAFNHPAKFATGSREGGGVGRRIPVFARKNDRHLENSFSFGARQVGTVGKGMMIWTARGQEIGNQC